jgi:hypothetical protein
MANVGEFFKKTLPSMALTVASGVPGPVGMVAGLISGVIGKTIKPDPAALDTAIQGATPDQIIALQEKDLDVKAAMAKMGYDDLEELARVASADTADARLMQRTDKSWIPATLALLVTFGFFSSLAAVLHWGIPAAGHDVIISLITTEGTVWLTIITFFFGSSAGSAAKNAPLVSLANAAANGGK